MHFITLRPRTLQLIAVLTLPFISSATLAKEIIIGGTGNGLGTMKKLSAAYSAQHPDIKITVLPSIGSSGGIKAVKAGAIHLGIAGRPLKAAEQSPILHSAEFTRSPAVLATSPATQATDITQQQLAGIYSDKIQTWPDGSNIRPLVRSPYDASTRLLSSLTPEMTQAMASAQKNMKFPFGNNDQHTATTLESQPGAIGLLSLSLILSEHRELKLLSLDGIAATPENLASAKYPMYYSFYLVSQTAPEPHVADFIEFVSSEAGHSILSQFGHFTLL
ncbi:PstS family phosphate ABC transporter substrate-binding protein [Shewanella sp. 125m-7]